MSYAVIISKLHAEYSRFDRLSMEAYEKLAAILDNADDETLIAFANATIPFVSSLSMNRAVRRGLIKPGLLATPRKH
jgi:hypothetical protein